ncbi:MAG: NAD-glutamate dehydrogenase [marine benthic group bacterium]|nr:NAD-glutamate dehydrogenase [Candidatus Benthicola marisminoris]
MMEREGTMEDRVADVIEALAARLPDHDPELLGEFGRKLLSRAPADRLEEAEPGLVSEQAAALFRLLEDTESERIGVRLTRLPDRPHRAVLFTVMSDCAFIVETLQEMLTAEGYSIIALLHPILSISRDPAGRVAAIGDRVGPGTRTSATMILFEGLKPDDDAGLAAEVERRLGQVQLATGGFESMMGRAQEIERDLEGLKEALEWRSAELTEVQEFLEWLRDGNFVFLGFREYEIRPAKLEGREVQLLRGSSCGILSDELSSKVYEAVPVEDLPSELTARVLGGPLLMVSKTNALSPVHRRARMDDVSIKRLAPDGTVLGERRFLGLFTAKAFTKDASATPILRRKLAEILEEEEVETGTHDHGLIVRLFNSLPKEDLFVAPVGELLPVIDALLETHASGEVLLLGRPDPLGRGATLMVVMPRNRFSAEVRQKVQDLIVEAYGGQILNYHLALGEGSQARLHFHVAAAPEAVSRVDLADLREKVRETIRSWGEKVRAALEETVGPQPAAELVHRYGSAFSSEYVATTPVRTAVRDIEVLEEVRSSGMSRVTLLDLDPPEDHRYWLTAFDRGESHALSDVMPVLENFGFRVIRAEAHDVALEDGGQPLTIHGFLVDVPAEWNVDRATAEPRVEEALRAVQAGWAENLFINRLILSAGLTWRQVALLKAYGAYAFRIGAVSSRLGLRRPIVAYPKAARLLWEIFAVQFDPSLVGDRVMAGIALRDAFQDTLKQVEGIDDDRTLRRLLNLIDCTTRTNYFQARRHASPEAPIALKFDCRQIEAMPEPRPRHEIWVNSARTEGAHLRMGDVARGGLRWSDRLEDFRVEVLGLVKTQQVKNAVIVPEGAKGAFVVSRPPEDRALAREAGVTSYRDFVSALLDITDNVENGQVVHPDDCVIRDGEDPYLVVAADKGTATLSDTANGLSAEYGFWMGDAFASGGSKGYDHKEMGITARGAWECVKRHFREMGKNIQEEAFTAVGIGDMSGDVFGNGMLLSRETRLLAAFDHRNIFIDPDPDPEVSWHERKRLFELTGSSWTDYASELISEGGGVWGRGDKQIHLSPQARNALGIEEETLNGEALVRAILGAPVELWWNGGIGTYVRATSETDAEVSDPSNDLVRIPASELRARVVGEGGNLGLTQRGRIEYALHGGRLNTDALDNSAGVDTSDHEVNLKILLGQCVSSGEMSEEERDALLAAVEDQVGRAVLRNSYTQSLAVSLDQHRVRKNPTAFGEALVSLERAGLLDRGLENLPSSEALSERLEQGTTYLTRPELSVLLAYAKMQMKRCLADSDLLDDPALLDLVHDYFATDVVEKVGNGPIEDHRLRSNIAATELTNRLVDTMGAAGLIQIMGETHRNGAEVAKAWYVAYRVSAASELFAGLHGLDHEVSAGVQAQWLLAATESLARSARWILANADLHRSVSELVSWYGEPVAALRADLGELLPEPKRTQVGDRLTLRMADGMNRGLAWSLVCLEFLDGLLPVAGLSRETAIGAREVGDLYFGIASDIDFPWLQDRLSDLPDADLWEQRAARRLAIDLESARRSIVRRLIQEGGPQGYDDATMASFRQRCTEGLTRIHGLVDELKASEELGLAALMVAVQAITDQCGKWQMEGRPAS